MNNGANQSCYITISAESKSKLKSVKTECYLMLNLCTDWN